MHAEKALWYAVVFQVPATSTSSGLLLWTRAEKVIRSAEAFIPATFDRNLSLDIRPPELQPEFVLKRCFYLTSEEVD
jgi:hypothetical protein